MARRNRRRRRKRFTWLRTHGGYQPLHLYYWSLGILFVLVLTGGGIPLISKAVALVGAGGLLLFRPPVTMPRPLILAGCGGFLVLGVLSMVLPRLAGIGPSLEPLVQTHGLSIPHTLSVQPLITLETLILFTAGVGWLFVLLDEPLSRQDRKAGIRAVVLVISFLGLLVLLGNIYKLQWPLAEGSQVFTFIANRNQMANMLMLGSFLCLTSTWESFRRKSDWSLVGVVVLVLLLLALFQLKSRAVVVLFMGGFILWLFLKSVGGSKLYLLKGGIPVALILFSLFLFFGAESRDRILEQLQGAGSDGWDFRFHIYQDAFRMFLERPVTGFGLGNFEVAFPQFREASFRYERIIHPESDFFWLLTETGFLGVIFMAVILLGVYQHMRVGSMRRADPHRLMLLITLLLFLLHGLVDVSAHRLGTVYCAMVGVGLGNRRRRPEESEAREWPAPVRIGWRVTGGVLIIIGVLWGLGWAFTLPTHHSVASDYVKTSLVDRAEHRQPEHFLRAANTYVSAAPLDWNAYFLRGSGLLLYKADTAQAASDFRVARFLNPTSARLTFQEGEAWLPVNPQWSLDAWRETLMRPQDKQFGHRRKLVDYYREHPSLREGILQISETDPGFRFQLLNYLRGEVFSRELEADLKYDPHLRFYSQGERKVLLLKWARSGGAEKLLELLRNDPGIAESTWDLEAVGLANTGRLREAIQLIRENGEAPVIPGDDTRTGVTQLEREFRSHPHDVLKGATLLQKQIEKRQWSDALQTARTLSRNPKTPPYVYYWAGEIYFMQDDLENSWSYFQSYLEQRQER